MKIGMMAVEEMMIDFEWQKYSGFLDVMEPYLAELTFDWNQEIEDKARGIEDEQEREDFYALNADDYENFHQFNVILANSFFSTTYFFFEHSLMGMCQRSKRNHNSPFSVGDIGGHSDLDRVNLYMTRLGLQFPNETQEWNDIRIYSRIRNVIVHSGGLVKPSWKDIDYARRKGILAGTEINPRLELTRSFCDEALNTFQQFLLKVLKADPRPTEA